MRPGGDDEIAGVGGVGLAPDVQLPRPGVLSGPKLCLSGSENSSVAVESSASLPEAVSRSHSIPFHGCRTDRGAELSPLSDEDMDINENWWSILFSWMIYLPNFIYTCLYLLLEIVFDMPMGTPEYAALQAHLNRCRSYTEWRAIARMMDEIDGYNVWRTEEASPYFNFGGVMRYTQELAELKRLGKVKVLLDALPSHVNRALYGMNNSKLYTFRTGTKDVIHSYVSLVCFLLRGLVENDNVTTAQERYECVAQMAEVYGETALALRGSTLVDAFHLGVAKALFEASVLPRVIYGSQTGALVAAFLCCRKDPSLYFDVGRWDFSAIEGKNGSLAPLRRWRRLVLRGYLYDSCLLLRFVRDNIGDLTFSDAWRHTGRVLNIQYISCIVDEETGKKQRTACLLNYLTAPHVLIYSAVVASITVVPWMGERISLLARDLDDDIVEFDPAVLLQCYGTQGKEGVDTVLQHIRAVFNVRYFVLSDCSNAYRPVAFLATHCGFFGRMLQLWLGEMGRLFFLFATQTPLKRYIGFLLFHDIHCDIRDGEAEMVVSPDLSLRNLYDLWVVTSKEHIPVWMEVGERQLWPRLEEVRMFLVIEKTLELTLAELRARYSDSIKVHCASLRRRWISPV